MSTLLLSQDQVKELITMKEIVEICEKTFQGFGEGTVVNPTKVNLDLGETAEFPPYKGFMNAMPAYIGWTDTAGIKWAGGNLGERKRLGLPYVTSLIMLIDPKVGNFTCVLDGAFITNMRTGAQTAVGLKYIFNGGSSERRSIKIGLYGAGMQGHTQTLAISQWFDIEEVRVYDVSKEAAEKYKENMKDVVKGEIIVCDTPKEAAQGDAIVCVTQSKDKFLLDEWVKPGTVIFPMGSYQECDDAMLLNAKKIVVDHVGQCLHRGALAELNEEGKITENSIFATIGELATGKKSIGDYSDGKIVCIPIGTGAMDIAVASVVYKKAIEQGIGGTYSFIQD
ncbi:ornithine cyclodeaminase family protein [Petroclostridium sp. X23]|uniref:ornithine cyclodeaminase family protein n=1 Tax=Petroclostridium sp. X23 TaxID=3045146 RepID=UPI0024AE1646|nr:ornithine cyclodeaminase family protein [Petroclostridium sp. X23]WHH60457.1 ornithine cyclodeaminase family protein [Petroclostridium sp. X23]